MSLNNKDLVKFAHSKLGTPYVYGTKGEVLTLEKYNWLKKTYGDLVWDSDKNKIGKVCCDCSGLISWYTGIIRGSSQYKSLATKVYNINTISNAPIGALVWQQGHIGIYIGNNEYIAEDGSAYGCRKNNLNKAKFTHWFLCSDIEYIEDGEEDMEKVYNWTLEVPEYGRPTVQKLLDKGFLKGNDKGELQITETMLRILVINDRAGLYDLKK